MYFLVPFTSEVDKGLLIFGWLTWRGRLEDRILKDIPCSTTSLQLGVVMVNHVYIFFKRNHPKKKISGFDLPNHHPP